MFSSCEHQCCSQDHLHRDRVMTKTESQHSRPASFPQCMMHNKMLRMQTVLRAEINSSIFIQISFHLNTIKENPVQASSCLGCLSSCTNHHEVHMYQTVFSIQSCPRRESDSDSRQDRDFCKDWSGALEHLWASLLFSCIQTIFFSRHPNYFCTYF